MIEPRCGVIIHFNDGSIEDQTSAPHGDDSTNVLRTVETFLTEYSGNDLYKVEILIDG